MRIVLLGSRGQVGWELQRSLAPLGEVIALDAKRTPDADFRDPHKLAALVRSLAPDAIVNAAAYTAVDKAEREPDAAHCINALAPAALGREARSLGVLLLHYSTDYVFDGSGAEPRDESAPTAPLNVYGLTKLEGEQRIRDSGCSHLILRTSWVYAARGGNFVRTMLRLAAERDALQVVDDQIGAPTGAELLADASAHALRQWQREPGLGGTYHLTASGATSWHGYARHVIEAARSRGQPVRVAPSAIEAVPSSAFVTPARRPLNSRLASGRFQRAFGVTLPPWQHGVERMLDEILPSIPAFEPKS